MQRLTRVFGVTSGFVSSVSGPLRPEIKERKSGTSKTSRLILPTIVADGSLKMTNTKSDPVGFPEFWKLYPRKEKRADAVKAFSQMITDPIIQFSMVMKSLSEQVMFNFKGRELQYIPLAGSWLRGERWDDPIYYYHRSGVIPPCDRPVFTPEDLARMDKEIDELLH